MSGHSLDHEADLDLADAEVIRYWSVRFRCTPIDLLAVVGRVGRSVSLVKAEIARRADVRGRSIANN